MNNRIFRHFPLICLMLLAMAVARAEDESVLDESILTEQHFFEEMPVVISGSRLATPLNESPLPITVLDKQLIEASGVEYVHQLLQLVPGFIAESYRGHAPVVSFLFINDSLSRRLQVMINNRSVYAPSVGGPIWRTLPLHVDDIERVEVIRGPNSAAYGSNSFLGVINIITKDPVLQHGWSYTTKAGNRHDRGYALQYGNGSGAWNYRFRLWHDENDGFRNRYDGSKVGYLDTQLDYRPGNRDTFSFSTGGSYALVQQDEPQDATTPDHDKNAGSHYQMIRWNRVLDNGSEISIKGFHNFDTHIERLTLQGIPVVNTIPFDQDFRSHRYDLEMQWSRHFGGRSKLVAGGSVRRDTTDSPRFLGKHSPFSIDIQRVFFNGAWHLDDHFQLSAGLTGENSNVNDFQVSPIIAANYHLSKHHTMRLTATSASRSPGAFEEKPDMVISSGPLIDQIFYARNDVDAERIATVDFGFLGSIAGLLQYEISFAKHKIDDMIVSDEQPLTPQQNIVDTVDNSAAFFVNSDKAEFETIQTSVRYQGPRLLWHTAFAWARGMSPLTLQADERLDDATPKYLASMLVGLKTGKRTRFTLGLYHRENSRGIDNTVQIPSSDRVDLGFCYKKKLQTYEAEFYLTGRNLSETYKSIYPFNEDQRQILATVKIRMN